MFRSNSGVACRIFCKKNLIFQTERIVLDLLAEAIMCMKATNADARRAAKGLLVQVTSVWHTVCQGRDLANEESLAESLLEILNRIIASSRAMSEDTEETAHRRLVLLDAMLGLVLAPRHKPLLQREHVKVVVDYCAEHLFSSGRLTVVRGGAKGLQQLLSVTSTAILPLSVFMAALEAIPEAHRHALRFEVKALLLKLNKRVG